MCGYAVLLLCTMIILSKCLNWISSISCFFFLLRFTGPSCLEFSQNIRMQNRSNDLSSAFGGNKKTNNKKTDWANDERIPLNNREDIYIYICKSTFISIIDALEWKQQQRGSLWSTNNCPTCTQHIPLIYYLNLFTCAINMHEYMSLYPPRKTK